MIFFAAVLLALMLLARRLNSIRAHWVAVLRPGLSEEIEEEDFEPEAVEKLLKEGGCGQEWVLAALLPLFVLLLFRPQDVTSQVLLYGVLSSLLWLGGVLLMDYYLKQQNLRTLEGLFRLERILQSLVLPIRRLKSRLIPFQPSSEDWQTLLLELRADMSHQAFLTRHGADSPLDEARIREFLLNLDKLFTQSVQSVMTPIHHVVTLSPNVTVVAGCEKSAVTGFSRLPVLATEGKVLGIFRANQLGLLARRFEKVDTELDEELRIPLESTVWEAFELLQRNQRQMGIVYRGIRLAGVITIEDILEELVGDIEDEFDMALVKRVARDTYDVDARIAMGPLERLLGRFPGSKGTGHLASWLRSRLGPELKEGARLDIRELRLVVTKIQADSNSIHVRIYRLVG